MNDRFRAAQILLDALGKSTPAERNTFLDEACGGDIALRQQIDRLLAASVPASNGPAPGSADMAETSYAAPPSSESAPPATEEPPQRPTEGTGARIGPYRLLQPLGEGGMGTVFLAEQEQPVKRRVALKIIKAGMDSAQVIARFEQERQALAMMDHPHIARVLDAGTTDSGRPFFVMELVKGIPITQFCDQERLTPLQRLDLFLPVCEAVQHAHQKGIIHRDLKPSNVLVALYDGKPVPKVIDFGVAKATSQKLTERTMFTEIGSIVGTLEYMAPEQAELNNLDIDTRADIYSLGVLLYELLTGSPPFTAQQLRGAAYAEMLRMIREIEPPKPSTRISSSESLPTIAANRQLDPRRLASLVTGDLDWIVMKALEKERARRYETANALARDLQRYLADEPVSAGPPSALYRLRKFVRRNRGQVIAASLLLLTLLGGIVGTTSGLIRAWAAEAVASQRLTEVEAANRTTSDALRAAQDARQQAERSLKDSEAARSEAEAVSDYMADILQRPNPDLDGRQVKIADVLDRAAERIAADFPTAPRIQAKIFEAVGKSYRGLGLPGKAVAIQRKHVELAEQTYGNTAAETGTALVALGDALMFDGSFRDAIEMLTRAIGILETAHGPMATDVLMARSYLGKAHHRAGQLPEAIRVLEGVRKTVAETSRPAAPLGSRIDRELRYLIAKEYGTALLAAGRTIEGLAVLEQELNAVDSFSDPTSQPHLILANDLATAYADVGEYAKALQRFEFLYEAQRARLGDDHPHTLVAAANWAGTALNHGGSPARFLPVLRDVVERRSRVFGADHRSTLEARLGLLVGHVRAGDYRAAIEQGVELLSNMRERNGPADADTLRTMSVLAGAYCEMRDFARGFALFDELLRIAATDPEAGSWRVYTTLDDLAHYRQRAADLPGATDARRKAVADCVQRYGHQDVTTLNQRVGLATLLVEAGQAEEGLELMTSVVDDSRAALGPSQLKTLQFLNTLGDCQRKAGHFDEAVATYLACIQLKTASLGPRHAETLASRNNLAVTHADAGRQDVAIQMLEDVLAGELPTGDGDSEGVSVWRENLAEFYAKSKRHAEAVQQARAVLTASDARLGPAHPKNIQRRLALARRLLDNRELAEAAREFQRTEELAGERAELAEERIRARAGSVRVLRATGQTRETLELLEGTVELALKTLPGEHHLRISSVQALADQYSHMERFEEAAALYRRLLEQDLAKDPQSLTRHRRWQLGLAAAEFGAGKRTEAIAQTQEVIAALRDDGLTTGPVMNSAQVTLASMYQQSGRPAEAVALLEATLAELGEGNSGEESVRYAALGSLATGYLDLKRHDDAARTAREARESCARLAEDSADETLLALDLEARALAAANRDAEAEALFAELLARATVNPKPADQVVAQCQYHWADYLVTRRRYDQAEPVLRAVLATLQEQQASAAAAPALSVHLLLATIYKETRQPARRQQELESILSADDALQQKLPEVVLLAKRELGHHSWEQGEYKRALQLYTEVRDGFTQLRGPNDPAVLQATFNQAAQHLGLQDYAQAEATLVALLEQMKPLELTPEIKREQQQTRDLLMQVYGASEQWDRQEQVIRDQLATSSQETPQPDVPDQRILRARLAICLANQAKHLEATQLLEAVMREERAVAMPRLDFLDACLMNLASIYSNARDFEKALEIRGQQLAMVAERFGAHDERCLAIKIELAQLYGNARQFAQGEATVKEVLAVLEGRPNADPAATISARQALARIYMDSGQVDAAETLLRQILAQLGGADKAQTREIENNLAVMLYWRGRYADALPIFQRLVEQENAEFGPTDPRADVTKFNVACQYFGLGEYQKAASGLSDLIATMEQRPTKGVLQVAESRLLLAKVYRKQQQLPLAKQVLEPLIPDEKPTVRAVARLAAKVQGELATCYLEEQSFDRARQAAESALAVRPESDPLDYGYHHLRSLLGASLAGQRHFAEGEQLLRESIAGLLEHRQRVPRAHWEAVPKAALTLSRLYDEWGKAEQSAEWKQRAEELEKEL